MCVLGYFPQDTAYFGGGEQKSMVNFRVDDLEGLLANLATAGMRIDPARENYSYGKFAWIWDPEGNRVELWEPFPSGCEDKP
jgi:predicted enzyme related to lactoylglutathione lyase